ncbi:MAG: type III pantothenate kinase [Planctomycetes bacterium]|nr:type III pantothenate kinase [Planctomycetota bacterium]
MAEQILTIDLGNSACKLCLFESLDATWRVAETRAFANGPALTSEVAAFVEGRAQVAAAALSGVAQAALELELARALTRHFGERFQSNPIVAGMDLEYSPPDALGRDRLYAARGALAVAPSAAALIVVDAGTALTVDAVANNGSRPRFLGGAIAPGPRLLADALARNTARLPRIDPRPGALALGRDTQGALQAGVVVGLRGAVLELVRRIEREGGFDAATLVVTGGARELLLRPESCFGTRGVIEDAQLVHRGLLHALLDAR